MFYGLGEIERVYDPISLSLSDWLTLCVCIFCILNVIDKMPYPLWLPLTLTAPGTVLPSSKYAKTQLMQRALPFYHYIYTH
jgi:hypothetical protein